MSSDKEYATIPEKLPERVRYAATKYESPRTRSTSKVGTTISWMAMEGA